MIFFVGAYDLKHASEFERCMISVNRLYKRRSMFRVNEWMMDSGAFSELYRHGRYCAPVSVYAEEIRRWAKCGNLLCAVSQDYMCEPFILERTGMTVAKHQQLTIERYDELRDAVSETYIMPVLQGYRPREYYDHMRQYGKRLAPNAWVGVGSVCKRNSRVSEIIAVLLEIKQVRPDLRLHGFGVKTTSLRHSLVLSLLHSADSMAWSFANRREGRKSNDRAGAHKLIERVSETPDRQHYQYRMDFTE